MPGSVEGGMVNLSLKSLDCLGGTCCHKPNINSGVENIVDHGTIGPRKFFMLAERKKERKNKGERKKRKKRWERKKRKEKRKEKESKERESNCTNK
jgi:hypothetical protein